jgi:dGTPase
MGIAVGKELELKKELPTKITPHDIGAVVQAACVAHDIGNPPFGHAGEYAIRHWYKNNLHLWHKCLKNEDNNERIINDLILFEGNAQGLRILTQLENYVFNGGLRLTYSTLSSTIKYPWGSNHVSATNKGKFSIFNSEIKIYEDIANATSLIKNGCGEYSRHPLSYLVEAADDICYKIIDIEDALELKICRLDDVKEMFFNMGGEEKVGNIPSGRREIIYLRTLAINNLINKCVSVFKSYYNEIMSGEFENDLISKIRGKEEKGVLAAKKITEEKIFNDQRKIEIEIGSHSCIDIIMKSLVEAVNQFKESPIKMTFKSKQLFKLMGENKPNEGDSYYNCYMKINDYISGMTDNYATFIAGQINGMAN